MTTAAALIAKGASRLTLAGIETPQREARLLLAHLLDMPAAWQESTGAGFIEHAHRPPEHDIVAVNLDHVTRAQGTEVGHLTKNIEVSHRQTPRM